MLFVQVILPLALPVAYTYGVPVFLWNKVGVGKRVVARMQGIAMIGIIQKTEEKDMAEKEAQAFIPIIAVIDEQPIVSEQAIAVWQWIADYYMCDIGSVMRYALPLSFRPSLQTFLKYVSPEQEGDALSVGAQQLLLYMQTHALISYADLKKIKIARKHQALDELLRLNRLAFHTQWQEIYYPKKHALVYLHPNYRNTEAKNALLKDYAKKLRTYSVLLRFFMENHTLDKGVAVSALSESVGKQARPVLRQLVAKGILYMEEAPITRLAYTNHHSAPPLTEEQKHIHSLLSKAFLVRKPILLVHNLHYPLLMALGGSISELLNAGGQVLYMLSEESVLSLSQRQRYHTFFGGRILFWTRHTNAMEKHEIWQKILTSSPCIVCADTTNILFPFTNLRAIYMEEEASFVWRRRSVMPFFHTRDVLLYMGLCYNAQVVLCAIAPSAASYYHTLQDKYTLIKYVKENTDARREPKVDMIPMLPDKSSSSTAPRHQFLSETLVAYLHRAASEGKAVFLFQPKIGYAPYMICAVCGEVPKCRHCDVALTYFKKKKELRCRYCASAYPVLSYCPHCFSYKIEERKFGTEKIEEHIRTLFPTYKAVRLDEELMRSKRRYEQILQEMASEDTIIFVGSKRMLQYLPLHRLLAVAVLDVDAYMGHLDFRAYEEGLRGLMQLKRVVMQARDAVFLLQRIHPKYDNIPNYLNTEAYLQFLQEQLHVREKMNYPPYKKLLRILFKGRVEDKVAAAAHAYSASLTQMFPALSFMGPTPPVVSKIRDEYLWELHVKMPRGKFWAYDAKKKLQECSAAVKTKLGYGVDILFYVDV